MKDFDERHLGSMVWNDMNIEDKLENLRIVLLNIVKELQDKDV